MTIYKCLNSDNVNTICNDSKCYSCHVWKCEKCKEYVKCTKCGKVDYLRYFGPCERANKDLVCNSCHINEIM